MQNMKLKKFYLLVIFFSFSFLVLPLLVKGATLYLLPQSQTVYQGDTFIVEVRLDTEEKEINTVGIDLTFPTDLLEVIDLSKGGSVLTLWVEEPMVKDNIISFVGGTPGGFKGEGLIGKITFLGKEIGKAIVDFKDTPKVFYGEGILTEPALLEGDYEIINKPEGLPIVSSITHPDQGKWYDQDTLRLHWDLAEGAEYSFILSNNPLASPDETPDRPEGELIWMGDMEYQNLEDGIYYFSLRQKLPNEDWSGSVSLRVMIDTTAPEEFVPEIGQDPSMFEGKYFLSFATTDKTSGIDYFQVKEGKRDFTKVESPYILKDQNLQSKILVKAVDKAGNEKITVVLPLKKPFSYWKIIVILIGVMVVIWIIYKSIQKRKKKEHEE
jgi:hypothetical protein